MIGTRQFQEMDASQSSGASAPPAEERAAAGGNLVEGDPSVSSRTPQASVQAAQSIAQGDNQLSEKKRAIIAMTRILGSGTLDEESLRLLEQLADCIQRPQAEVTREVGPVKLAAAQQVTPAEGESAETEPAELPTGEPSLNGDSERDAEEKVIVGSLRTLPEDRWMCKVPSCTGGFHRLKDCRLFKRMDPEDRFKLADQHSLCLGCLTPGHGRAARSCPYEEE